MAAVAVTLACSSVAFQGGHVSERLVDSPSAQGVHRAGRAGPLSEEYASDKSDLPRSETCPHARKGLRFYTKRASDWRQRMGVRAFSAGKTGVSHSCPQLRRAAEIARWNAYKARYHAERFLERMRDPAKAICHVFGAYCAEAIAVAKCESGWSMTPRAHNGQYLGSFQMGEYARARYGHGDTVLEQARAAYAYFKAAGSDWSPWACQP